MIKALSDQSLTWFIMFLGDRVVVVRCHVGTFSSAAWTWKTRPGCVAPTNAQRKPNHESNKKSASQIAFITSNWNPKLAVISAWWQPFEPAIIPATHGASWPLQYAVTCFLPQL